jgi:hypothetical protein
VLESNGQRTASVAGAENEKKSIVSFLAGSLDCEAACAVIDRLASARLALMTL